MPIWLARCLVDADVVQRLAHVEIALADRDDADLRAGAAGIDDAVEPVGADEGGGGGALVFMQPRFLAEHVDLVADVEAAGRHVELGHDDVERGRARHRPRPSDSMLSLTHLIAAQVPAKRDRAIAVEAVVDDLLHAGRVEDRDHRVDEEEFGRMRVGRGFGRVVVAHQRQHAAMLRRAGQVGVAEHVARAVDARALAVPEREDAVMRALAEQFGLLRSPSRRWRQVPR